MIRMTKGEHAEYRETVARLSEFKNSTGRYSHRPPERAIKRPIMRTHLERTWAACDDAYLLERGGFDEVEAWTRACLGNGLEQGDS